MASTRLIVPDAARGMALLGIAIANMTTAWIITEDRPGAYFGGILNDFLISTSQR